VPGERGPREGDGDRRVAAARWTTIAEGDEIVRASRGVASRSGRLGPGGGGGEPLTAPWAGGGGANRRLGRAGGACG
jgi:hypothetical protein